VVTAVRKLRPAKIRNALRRRWFERQMHRITLEQTAGVIELGSPYGGWTIPEHMVEPSWVCYCVGAGGDISFDIDLMELYGVEVRSFDAVSEYVQSAREQAAGHERFSAHHAAITARDEPVRLQVTHDAGSKSVSPAGLYESDRFIEVPGRTIASLMAELGDQRIDLLKLDIEGGEYELMPQLDLRALGVKIFAVQMHHTSSLRSARKLVRNLRDAGYEPVACRRAVKITFALRELRLATLRDAEDPPSGPNGEQRV
jgi:FkbM family methyltransferase